MEFLIEVCNQHYIFEQHFHPPLCMHKMFNHSIGEDMHWYTEFGLASDWDQF